MAQMHTRNDLIVL